MADEREFGILLAEVRDLKDDMTELKRQQKESNEFLNRWKGVIGFFVVCAAVGGFLLQMIDKVLPN